MTFKFLVNNRTSISLASDNPNVSSPLFYEGDTSNADQIYVDLQKSLNPFGHLINPDFINAIDLHYALTKAGYTVEILEGSDQLKTYNPQISKESVT